ncbi:hypothetical protein BT96DRAFT_992314 [Gymnopus androsaceus JB14]|uniref:Uncharacterized protein n=1 Tax=Gymnopus androsaceus JB14 TaxID=1447944 RepID=A0A6A4HS96_9AGAR|nr:hypothetical protein BT96DRAFT_992314 [Gymnopus androsaceus JB14]
MTSFETWPEAIEEILKLNVEINRLFCAFFAGVFITLVIVLVIMNSKGTKRRVICLRRPVDGSSSQVLTAKHVEFAALLQKLALEQLRIAQESKGVDISAESEDEVQVALTTFNSTQR